MDHPVLTVEVAQLFAEQLILSHAGGRPRAALLLAAMNAFQPGDELATFYQERLRLIQAQ